MALKLFEYAVILQPLQNKDGKIVEEGQILVGVKTVLAKDDTQVQLIASREIPEESMSDLDRLQVVVRPFDEEYDVDDFGREISAPTLGPNFYATSPTSSSSYTSLSNITASGTGINLGHISTSNG